MIIYRRDVPVDLFTKVGQDVQEHVIAHLSAIADPDDDLESRAGDVHIKIIPQDDNQTIAVIGEIDAEPSADYLNDQFDPDHDYPDITFQPIDLDAL